MKTGAKVLLRVNVDIQGCLFNGQTGSIIHSEFVLGRQNLFQAEFKKSAIKVNKDALLEYECLKQYDLFSTIKRNTLSDDALTIFVHNVRSLLQHADDVVSDGRIINNDIIGLTKTQVIPSDSTFKIIERLNFSEFDLNDNEQKSRIQIQK